MDRAGTVSEGCREEQREVGKWTVAGGRVWDKGAGAASPVDGSPERNRLRLEIPHGNRHGINSGKQSGEETMKRTCFHNPAL